MIECPDLAFKARLPEVLERSSTRFGDCVVLVAGAAADADCAYDFSILLQGDAPGEDHDLAVIARVDAEELVAGLGMGGEVFGGNVKGT